MSLPLDTVRRRAPSGLEILANYFLPYGAAGTGYNPDDDELPFRLVQRYDGVQGSATQRGYYQIDDLARDFTTAEEQGDRTLEAMVYLKEHPWTEIEIQDPRNPAAKINVTVDYVRIDKIPTWDGYENPRIQRFISRYTVDLRVES